MTDEEFRTNEREILSELPIEIANVVSSIAWQQGHSSGYHEVLNYVQYMAYSFELPIKAYRDRIYKEALEHIEKINKTNSLTVPYEYK